MNNKAIVTILVFLFLAGAVLADSDDSREKGLKKLNELQMILSKQDNYTLKFEQMNLNPTTGQSVKGNGTLTINTIKRFKWTYESRPQNLIVCDGVHLAMITPDTEQIMIDDAAGFQAIWSPVSIITDINLLNEYTVTSPDGTPSDTEIRLRFVPHNQNSPFDFFEIVFSNDIFPFKVIIRDSAGSTNTLTFNHFEVLSNPVQIKIPEVPFNYDVTDFQGNPKNMNRIQGGN